MNKQNINTLNEGDKINMPMLITALTKGITTSGAPYISLTLQDQTGTIEAKVWDAKEDQVAAIAQINDVLTGHPEDARYITRAQQQGLDPLHIHHRPSQTPKTQ